MNWGESWSFVRHIHREVPGGKHLTLSQVVRDIIPVFISCPISKKTKVLAKKRVNFLYLISSSDSGTRCMFGAICQISQFEQLNRIVLPIPIFLSWGRGEQKQSTSLHLERDHWLGLMLLKIVGGQLIGQRWKFLHNPSCIIHPTFSQ